MTALPAAGGGQCAPAGEQLIWCPVTSGDLVPRDSG